MVVVLLNISCLLFTYFIFTLFTVDLKLHIYQKKHLQLRPEYNLFPKVIFSCLAWVISYNNQVHKQGVIQELEIEGVRHQLEISNIRVLEDYFGLKVLAYMATERPTNAFKLEC